MQLEEPTEKKRANKTKEERKGRDEKKTVFRFISKLKGGKREGDGSLVAGSVNLAPTDLSPSCEAAEHEVIFRGEATDHKKSRAAG